MRLTSQEIRTLLAVVYVYRQMGRATVRDVAVAQGRSRLSPANTHHRLVRLRALGLVAWDEGKTGTLRPLVETVPMWRDDA